MNSLATFFPKETSIESIRDVYKSLNVKNDCLVIWGRSSGKNKGAHLI